MKTFNRREFFRLGAGAALGTVAMPRVWAAEPLPAHEQALYEQARKEGELTWYTGQMQAEPSEAVGRAFSALYPGIKVNVVRSASQTAFQRVAQDLRAGMSQCDVFSSTEMTHMLALRKQEALQAYRAENAARLVPFVREGADAEGYFQTSYLLILVLVARSSSVSPERQPKSWGDLIKPEWKDKIAVGHPGYSGALVSWCVMLQERYGWDFFAALEKNNPHIGRSSADPLTLLNAGERELGAGVALGTTMLSASRGNPLTVIYPEDGTPALRCPSSILKKAPHPAAARLFMEFIARPEYSETVKRYFVEPLREDVSPYEGARSLADMNLVSPDPEKVARMSTEVKERWRDTFGI